MLWELQEIYFKLQIFVYNVAASLFPSRLQCGSRSIAHSQQMRSKLTEWNYIMTLYRVSVCVYSRLARLPTKKKQNFSRIYENIKIVQMPTQVAEKKKTVKT